MSFDGISIEEHNLYMDNLRRSLRLEYEGRFIMAIERLEDMLKGDDGQAWKEAQRFVDRFRESE